jgi:cytochrome c551/c552
VRPSFDPAEYASRGAVGLVVPGSGRTVTRAGALASLVRGKVRNAVVGGVPSGTPLIRLSRSPGPVTIYVALPPPGRTHNVHRYPIAIVGGGYHGKLTSSSTRIGGLVSIADIAPTALALEHGTSPPIRSRADANAAAHLRALDARIHDVHDLRIWAMLIVVFGTILLLPTGAALLAPLAALGAALALSAAGATNTAVVLVVLAAATLLVPPALIRVAPWVVVVFLAVLLVVLVAAPETNALAVIGPHPDGGGRYFGLTNQVETMLLAPALAAGAVLGALPVGLLAIVVAGWSKSGADGGAVVVYAAAFAVLELRSRRLALTPLRLAAIGAGAAAVVAALVGVDLLAGGSDHVTESVRHGSVFSDWGHRLHVSWAGATSSWYAILICVAFLGVLAGCALVRPRTPTVEAFLVGIVVSLLVNDTPTDVIGFGALGCSTLVAWELTRRPSSRPFSRLAAVRHPVTLLVLLCALVATAAGCGSAKVVSPTAQTVIGTLPQQQQQQTLPTGDATAGKALFTSQGCTGCHTFTPAGSTATVGPDLDKLAAYAKKANQGPEKVFVEQSITNPSAYVESGYSDVMPKTYGDNLSRQQLADLIAFLTTKS